MTLRRVALLAISANLLAACGGGSKDDLQVAVDRLNGGPASTRLRESLEAGGGVSFCRITPQPDHPERLQLTVVMKDSGWYLATLDPEMDEKLQTENVTTGKNYAQRFGHEHQAELRMTGRACTVAANDGAVSLN
jgi:hypothetical protein